MKTNKELQTTIKELTEDNNKKQRAINALLDYWDSIPDEEKPLVNKVLEDLGQ